MVRQFENDNEAYNKIRKTAEEKVNSILSVKKEILRLAIFCVIETIIFNTINNFIDSSVLQ